MKWFMTVLLLGVLVAFGFQSASQSKKPTMMMKETSAATYEQLATAIIALRNTETNLVRGIMMHSFTMAQREGQAALDAKGRSRSAHFEAAAREITHLASEGDPRIQAVRQRLLEAGHHHHHSDAEQTDDYIFINSAEKKMLLDLANRIAKFGPDTADDDIRGAMDELSSTYDKAMMDE